MLPAGDQIPALGPNEYSAPTIYLPCKCREQYNMLPAGDQIQLCGPNEFGPYNYLLQM